MKIFYPFLWTNIDLGFFRMHGKSWMNHLLVWVLLWCLVFDLGSFLFLREVIMRRLRLVNHVFVDLLQWSAKISRGFGIIFYALNVLVLYGLSTFIFICLGESIVLLALSIICLALRSLGLIKVEVLRNLIFYRFMFHS